MFFKRPFGDNERPFVYVETDAQGNIVPEPWDGGLDHHVSFKDLNIYCKPKDQNKFTARYISVDKRIDLYVTDSRLIFQHEPLIQKLKFNGSFIDYGVDALFKKSEDKELEGLGIIGHIRYEWLAQVMYFEKYNWKTRNKLRFVYYDNESAVWQVTATFENDMDVRFLANEILHSACRYRERTTDEKRDALKAFIEKYKTADIPPAADPKNQFSYVSFPSVKLACFGENNRPPLE